MSEGAIRVAVQTFTDGAAPFDEIPPRSRPA
jgi:hypothetical protein